MADNDCPVCNGSCPSCTRPLIQPEEEAALRARVAELERVLVLRPASTYHDDFGRALWYELPIRYAPYVGDPLCEDFPWSHENLDDTACDEWLMWVPLPKVVVP